MVLSKRKSKIIYEKKSLISYQIPDSKFSEQYRTIRTNIQFLSGEYKSFLVTSSGIGEGKSTSAVNLAISMAQQRQKVLLVDANFRNPVIHTIFHFSNKLGLSNVLQGHAILEDAVNKTEVGRLEVLTSGPIPFNPAELLGSQPMKKLIKEFIEKNDAVIFDSPSVLDYADTAILANQCNAVILVIKNGKTSTAKALECKRSLERGKASVIGVIFNEK